MNPTAQPSAIVCTAADAGYFHLLEGLIESLKAGPAARALPIGVLDLGLAPDQRTWLEAQGARLVIPDWDLEFPWRTRTPSAYRAMTARPFLPRHFPDHAMLLWLDADTWVQDDSVLGHFVAAASGGKLAIVPELDRGYSAMYKPPKLWGQNQKAFAWAFGLRAGYRYGRNPILNSGAFALAADAPHWSCWAETLRAVLNRRRFGRPSADWAGYFFLAEQTALNHVVFADKLPHTLLPATANWFVAKGLPYWDAARGVLVEPHAPHALLGIVHLAGARAKKQEWNLATLDGGTVTLRPTWAGVQAARGASARP